MIEIYKIFIDLLCVYTTKLLDYYIQISIVLKDLGVI